jgi:hypothetical protein
METLVQKGKIDMVTPKYQICYTGIMGQKWRELEPARHHIQRDNDPFET